MCILSYLPPGTPADVHGLFNGGANNPDGHGWAIVAGEEIVSAKSLELVDALDEFVEARERYPDGPALFHSRWATHGSVRVDNVHPFLVGGSRRTVVAHNGILPKGAHPLAGDDRSDTRKFAEEILPRQYRRLDRAGVQRALSRWCGLGNKLVILTVDPRYRNHAYIVNEDAGQWDAATGIWHSNDDYVHYPNWSQLGTSPARADSPGRCGDVCAVCGYGLADAHGYCDSCRSCQDCWEDVGTCMCWNRRAMPSDDYRQSIRP
ncbi:class II glutamine amidotransferase [Mycobacterium servetii]|uniref:Glucosamine 6-phosphate synthetase n=1 Tax=Mycobacterium servetii TaxID=3237418 RepID=A0ABV4C9F9_9MYCO